MALLALSAGALADGSTFGKTPPVTQISVRDEGLIIYELTGDIESGAEHIFRDKVGDRTGGLLMLRSVGGDLTTSMRIGRIVREHQIATYVETDCLSGCAIIWAAGHVRYKKAKGTIGFHHPWRKINGKVTPGDPVRLIVYFKILGFSDEAIKALLAPPDTFFYLTGHRAKELGIPMTVLR